MGRRFCELNGERSLWMFAAARLVCIPFSLLGAIVVAMWSREWFGNTAGLLSAALWCFSPNILAHGHLVTPDVAATALGVTTCYLFTRWLRDPAWQYTFLLGTSLAIALLCKATWIVLFGVLLLQWILSRLFRARRETRCEASRCRARYCDRGTKPFLRLGEELHETRRVSVCL
ncbi:MAG: glycosyltransferase family 39 protein [Planctomycetia bacterium]|nr:glycosyltransferase family 39 protein [Planctomycetia bacterium]